MATYAYDSAGNHTDHLNTPRLIADDTSKTVWRWDNTEPFGAGACNPDPDGDNVEFEFNLRFPGQYFDKETNAHYNYQRDAYDAAIGRYSQPEPLGLAGDINLYRYARGNPLAYIDPSGEVAFALIPIAMAVARIAIPIVGRIVAGRTVVAAVAGAATVTSSTQQCEPDKPDCQEHFKRCLETSLADEPGSVYGSSRCLLCRDVCVRSGGDWPHIAMTGGKSVRCDYWNYR